MKIVYLANVRIPTEKAHGIQIMQTCRAFARAGAEVELVVPRRRNHIKIDPFGFYGIEPNFRITRLPNIDLIGILPGVAFWLQTWSFTKFAGLYLWFRKQDIIYSRDTFVLWGLSFIKNNLVWEAHRGEKSWFARRVSRRAKGIIVITKALADLYVSLGVEREKILVARDGVDLARFMINDLRFKNKYREELGLPLDGKIIMYTGHLYDWKGAGVMLEVARLSLRPPTRSGGGRVGPPRNDGGPLFVFVGGTARDISKFKDQAEGLYNVLILGQKPHAEIPKYLAAADVLVLSNSGKKDISRLYTSPLKLFEYMAAGRPIVASNLPSIREILNEQNSVLVEPDNASDLARGLRLVLEDSTLAERIANQAREDVKQYDWNERAKKILEFIMN